MGEIKMSYIIGIDLGTTHSTCGVYRDGRVELIPNRLGKYLTPSVVSIDNKSQLVIGDIAKQRLVTHPEESVSTFKRHMGTSWSIKLGVEEFSATELSALVLRSLKEDASTFLNSEITRAVISVPAYFNNKQREATIQAGELAGLRVEAIINEPTAAAIAFGLHEKPEDTTFMVLDLGGGTFDISIMEYYDQILEVQATAGDNFLGGEDFTRVLIDFYLETHGLCFEKLTLQKREVIYTIMENAKKELNEHESIIIQPIFDIEQPFIITQKDYLRISSELLIKIKTIIKQAILDSKLQVSEIEDLILVGGSARLKIFKELTMKLFKRIPSAHVDPDLAIATGASIQAALKDKNKELADVVLTDVSPHTFGIAIRNPNNPNQSLYSPIIEKNTVIPVSRSENYFPTERDQTSLLLRVFQGENRLSDENFYLGELLVKIPKGSAGSKGVDVRFSYDTNGVLDIDVKVLSTGAMHNKVILSGNTKLNALELQTTLNRLLKFKLHPREDEGNITLIATAEKLYTFARGDLREQISNNIKWFEGILETQDRKKVATAAKEFAKFLVYVQEELNVFE